MEKPVDERNGRSLGACQSPSRERVIFALILITGVYIHMTRTEEGMLGRQLSACCTFLLS